MGLVVKNLTIKGKVSVGGSSLITDGVVLYLDSMNPSSYPGNGTTWYDLSGYGNNGFLSGGTSFDSNLKTLVFNGSNGYVNIPNSSSLDITGNSVTLSAWVYVLNHTSGTFRGIITKGYGPIYGGDPVYGGYSLHVRPPGEYQLWFDIANNPNRDGYNPIGTGFLNLNALWPNSSGPPSTRWHNVVCTFNSPSMSIYLNGYSIDTPKNSSVSTIGSTSQPVWIGRLPGYQYFQGYIQHVMIYNKSLTASEVLHNYNVIKGRFGL